MTEQAIVQLVGIIVGCVSTTTAAYFSFRSNQNTKAGNVVGEITARKVNDVHTLVNGAMGVALKRICDMAKHEADRSGDPDDIATYLEAQRLYDAHMVTARHLAQSKTIDWDKPPQPLQSVDEGQDI